jgi:hypothetical protein
MVTLEITIPIRSDWPTRKELAARNAVETALGVAAVGLCTGAGGGMGQMHLTYRLDDDTKVPTARAAIAEAMKVHMPDFQYRVAIH